MTPEHKRVKIGDTLIDAATLDPAVIPAAAASSIVRRQVPVLSRADA